MMLGEKDKIDRAALHALQPNTAGVSLKQANGSLVYFNVRMLRCSEPWICKGATHEAWTCPPERITAHFDEPVLADRNDGGCKSDKYPRDVRLLLQDLEEMPNDARTLFYLGQTYLCMRNYTEGIPVLKKRIEVGGWDEETYIAYMYLGECLMGSGRKDEAIKTWLDGWQYRQHRTEIPMKLITYYRNLDKSQFIATMFLEKLFAQQFGEDLRTGQPTGIPPVNNRDMLFVNKRDVDYHIYEELMILAYYSSLHKSAFLRLDDLDMKTNLHWHDFNSLFGQLHWYHWILKGEKQRLKPKISLLPWVDEDDAHI
jgi:tetratricopeptide (TPR) repeat protein